jgi:uncharacterized protein DUF4157
MRYRFFVVIVALFIPGVALSQGFATWVGDRLGAGNVGRALDQAHDRVKQSVPGYREAEDTVVRPVRHVATEAAVETAGPVLKTLIAASRDDALRAGAGQLPREILSEFRGFYSEEVLRARWRIGQGNELSLQANAFRFGDRVAIALDTVLVFRSPADANSLWLWAHELAHIEQYRDMGIDDFAKSYIRDSDSLEQAANRRANAFMTWRQRRFFPRIMLTSQTADLPRSVANGAGTLCRFSSGPRIGQVQDFAPMAGIPIGSSCQDGFGSTGFVVSPGQSQARNTFRVSTWCRFSSGPSAGTSRNYAPMQGLLVGSPCRDGLGSFGTVVAGDPPAGNARSSGYAMSSVCRFTSGRREGQSQDYAPRAPLPVGTPCHDGAGSFGVVSPSGAGIANRPVALSTLCRFTSGRRAGQIHDYAPMAPIPVGSPCQDGAGNFGIVIAR